MATAIRQSSHSGPCLEATDPRKIGTCVKCGRRLDSVNEMSSSSASQYSTVCMNIAEIMGWPEYDPVDPFFIKRVDYIAQVLSDVESGDSEAAEEYEKRLKSFISFLRLRQR